MNRRSSQASRHGLRRRLALAAIVGLAALGAAIAAMAVVPTNAQSINLGSGATISCTPGVGTYGEPTTCEVSSAVAAQIDWGDGQLGTLSHTVDLVGDVAVQLVSDVGIVLASTTVTIEPDLSLGCEGAKWKNVYEFAATDSTDTGWDYVYLNPDGGQPIGPDHPDHPADPGLTDLEPIVVDRVQETGECTAISAAADAFDGDITFTMGSKWEEHSVPFAQLKPWSNHHWKGTQPGFIDVAVTVNETTVSERRSVYLSGCT